MDKSLTAEAPDLTFADLRNIDDVPLLHFDWQDSETLHALADLVLAREADILGLPVSADWGGRHPELTSSHYANYNLLVFEAPAFGRLGETIRSAVRSAIERLQQKTRPVYIQCWANILREGQHLPKHAHSYPLHGHITIQTDGSVTLYGTDEPVALANRPGEVTVFGRPGLVHAVPAYQGRVPRISIAFDLLPRAWVEADPRWKQRFQERSFIPFDIDDGPAPSQDLREPGP